MEERASYTESVLFCSVPVGLMATTTTDATAPLFGDVCSSESA